MSNETSHRQQGQSIILVAVIFGALLLFVAIAVDMSSAYADRRQAQNAADAAVLGAAQELGVYFNGGLATDTTIKIALNRYAELNGIADTDGIPGNAVNDNVVGCYLNVDAECLDGLPPVESSARVGALGSIPADALGIEAVTFIASETFFGGIIGADELPLQAEAASFFESACTPGGCLLPIAIHERGFDDETGTPIFQDGQCYNLWDGPGSEALGWMNWSLQGYSCQDRGGFDDCSADCVELNMSKETCIDDPDQFGVGNDVWIGGATGVKNADKVLGWLKYYINNDEVVRVVVYDDVSDDGQGCGKFRGGEASGTLYHLAGFASFELTGFRLSKGQGKAVYCDLLSDGLTLRCGPTLDPSLAYTCDPLDSLDYPPCYDTSGNMVPCSTQASVTNRITGKARVFSDGDSGNCHAVGNLLAPKLRK